MQMLINIKAIGKIRGTIGWLREGLANGSLQLKEGHMRSNGHHGLWLKGPEGYSQFLAAYNEYGLSHEDGEYDRYAPCGSEDRQGGLTDACWASLIQIANIWCSACQEALNEEQPLASQVVRASIDTSAKGI